MSLTKKIKNITSNVTSWVNRNKKPLVLVPLNLYMCLANCSNGSKNFYKGRPTDVEKIGNDAFKVGMRVPIEKADSQDVVFFIPYNESQYFDDLDFIVEGIRNEIEGITYKRDPIVKVGIVSQPIKSSGKEYMLGRLMQFGGTIYEE